MVPDSDLKSEMFKQLCSPAGLDETQTHGLKILDRMKLALTFDLHETPVFGFIWN